MRLVRSYSQEREGQCEPCRAGKLSGELPGPSHGVGGYMESVGICEMGLYVCVCVQGFTDRERETERMNTEMEHSLLTEGLS